MKLLIVGAAIIIMPMGIAAYSNNANLHDNVNFTVEVIREAVESL